MPKLSLEADYPDNWMPFQIIDQGILLQTNAGNT
jgi:hypothetical protein